MLLSSLIGPRPVRLYRCFSAWFLRNTLGRRAPR